MQEFINNGIFTLNKNDSNNCTVVVLGIARTGTTMVANVLQNLGVDMGRKGGVVFEDMDVFKKLENDELIEFEQLVEHKNQEFEKWGWKRPRSIDYISKFESKIRNPHYIIPFRDLMAVAKRNSMAVEVDVVKNLVSTYRLGYSKVIKFIETNKKPLLLCSYEKAITLKENFVKEIADFVGVKDEDKIKNAVDAIEANMGKYITNNSKIVKNNLLNPNNS